jgi:hypothetical protein
MLPDEASPGRAGNQVQPAVQVRGLLMATGIAHAR